MKMKKTQEFFKSTIRMSVVVVFVVVLLVVSPLFISGSTAGSSVIGQVSAFSPQVASSIKRSPVLSSTVQRRSWESNGGIIQRPLSSPSSLRMTMTDLPWLTPLVSVTSSSTDAGNIIEQTNVDVILSLVQTLVVPLVAFVVVSTVIEKSLYSIYDASDDNNGDKNIRKNIKISNNSMESVINVQQQRQQQQPFGVTMKKTAESVQSAKATTTKMTSTQPSSSTIDDNNTQDKNSRRDALFKIGATAASFVFTDALLGAPGGGMSGGGGVGGATTTMELSSAARSQKMAPGQFNEATKNLIEFIEETQPYRIAKHPELRAWVNVQKAAMESAGFVFETASAAVMTAAAASAVTARRISRSTIANTGKDETGHHNVLTMKKDNEDGGQLLPSSSTDLEPTSGISSIIDDKTDCGDDFDEGTVESMHE